MKTNNWYLDISKDNRYSIGGYPNGKNGTCLCQDCADGLLLDEHIVPDALSAKIPPVDCRICDNPRPTPMEGKENMNTSETQIPGLHIRIWEHNTSANFECVLCGCDYQQNMVAASLEDGNKTIGDVCPACLGGGPKGAAERARQRIARLRLWADGLDDLATRAEAIPPGLWATWKDLQDAERRLDQKILGDPLPPADTWPGVTDRDGNFYLPGKGILPHDSGPNRTLIPFDSEEDEDHYLAEHPEVLDLPLGELTGWGGMCGATKNNVPPYTTAICTLPKGHEGDHCNDSVDEELYFSDAFCGACREDGLGFYKCHLPAGHEGEHRSDFNEKDGTQQSMSWFDAGSSRDDDGIPFWRAQ